MNNQPLVTIITPSLNQSQYIEDTIKSVLSQSYPNIEYIVMDGGSIDGTIEVIKKYESKISHWESVSDKGQTNAINKGLKIARGKYWGWLNSDDYLAPDVVERVVAAFESDLETGTVYGKINIIDSAGNLIEQRSNNGIVTYEGLLNGSSNVVQIGAFHRLDLIKKYGYLSEEYNYCMDYDLWLRLAKCSGVKNLGILVGYHRFHDSCKSIKEFHKFIPEIKLIRKHNHGKIICQKNYNLWRIQLGILRRKLLGIITK
ncbi:MAG TPA: hypothetical protein DF296_02630 [Candidatus Margulisbacteria bacterium]|nr:MAG: hypothetical protein A2X43_05885 [Candidatus Margulisbacteria bacterium GWD2_39_127]HCT84075.1 hypothetical protein [Candidatus Margulisiibacteriota bacterium]